MSKNASSGAGGQNISPEFLAFGQQYAQSIRSDAISRLTRLQHGDAIEVEQWGGLLSHEECPPVCGLWANVWRGTGVMLRLNRPFVSLSKATAIVEMIERVAKANSTAFEELVSLAEGQGRSARNTSKPSRGTPLDMLERVHLFARALRASAMRGTVGERVARRWAAFARRSSPEAVTQWVLQLGSMNQVFTPAERFALYWAMGICGKGQKTTPFWAASPVGPDGLLSTLACILGHKTVVLAASANDNGLLHQELVDFEVPSPMGWPAVADGKLNSIEICIVQQPFAILSDDARRGSKALASRRRQMLDFWMASKKFLLPTDPTYQGPQHFASCSLGFGRKGGPGSPAACIGPKVRTQPTATKACWAHCNGTLSQTVLASTSLGHVRGRDNALPRIKFYASPELL
eukprot:CAMPEP_0115833292 /NCGR_PEP_ID=MMETSP0287-20121206/3098_1 /TAXON_ID=412157 /ORGANISM="Chrysochromulina rotalis, Strain UIO044" /LENGTH=404 /DNA_ID=CAMNT_0003286703 /DNA_START=198 /DNA_END=1411 /DNA_ORIENTATION=-